MFFKKTIGVVGLFFYAALFVSWHALPLSFQIGFHLMEGMRKGIINVILLPSDVGPYFLSDKMDREVVKLISKNQ